MNKPTPPRCQSTEIFDGKTVQCVLDLNHRASCLNPPHTWSRWRDKHSR